MNTIGEVGAKEGYQYALVIKNGGDLVKRIRRRPVPGIHHDVSRRNIRRSYDH